MKVLVTIHGMGRFKWSMSHIGVLAKARGYHFINLGYSPREGELRDIAARLSKELISGVPDNATSVDLIAHSLGGLLVRAIDEQWNYDLPLNRAVTLGTPHSDCRIARLLADVSAIRWRFGAVFTELFDHRLLSIPRSIKVGSIGAVLHKRLPIAPWFNTPNDGLVALDETLLPGAADHCTIFGLHGVLMYSPTALRHSFYFLEHGRFDKNQQIERS